MGFNFNKNVAVETESINFLDKVKMKKTDWKVPSLKIKSIKVEIKETKEKRTHGQLLLKPKHGSTKHSSNNLV